MQQQMYDFVTTLINMLWLLAPIVGPFVLIRTIVRFIKWANASARGENLEDMDSDYNQEYERLQRMRYASRERNGYQNQNQRRHRW